MILTKEELLGLQTIAEDLSIEQITDTLQSLLQREKALYEQMPEDPQSKLIVLDNMACLIAATTRLMTES